MKKLYKNRKVFFVIIFFCIYAILRFASISQHDLRVIFLDVGQGDSTLMITPSGKTVLIDGGPDNKVVQKLGFYLPPTKNNIDMMILSHPDSDHIFGLVEILRRYNVKEIVMTRVQHTTSEFHSYISEIEKEANVVIHEAWAGQKYTIDGLQLFVLYPDESYQGKDVSEINSTSIVVKAVYEDFSILFTGDLESEYQNSLLDNNIESVVLKFPHHGSSDSLNQNFIREVNPEISIISVGENNYGHPSARVIGFLKRSHIETYMTSTLGDVIISSDGRSWTLLDK